MIVGIAAFVGIVAIVGIVGLVVSGRHNVPKGVK
jgi:hypothetical protein